MENEGPSLIDRYQEQLWTQQEILSKSIRRYREEGRIGRYDEFAILDDALVLLDNSALAVPSFMEAFGDEGVSTWILLITIVDRRQSAPIRMETIFLSKDYTEYSKRTRLTQYSVKYPQFSEITTDNMVNGTEDGDPSLLDFQRFANRVVAYSY